MMKQRETQRERTLLSWVRTCLLGLVVSTLLARFYFQNFFEYSFVLLCPAVLFIFSFKMRSYILLVISPLTMIFLYWLGRLMI